MSNNEKNIDLKTKAKKNIDFQDKLNSNKVNTDKKVIYDPKINYIINPSDYVIIDFNKHCDNKKELSEEILINAGTSKKVIKKMFNIKKKIKKNLIYGIKKKGDQYRIEIYLYKKNINHSNHFQVSKENFKINLKIILEELGCEYTEKIDSIINNLEIYLISFDIDLVDCSFNNKLHIYLKNEDKYYTATYDIDTNEISYESYFVRIDNYMELKVVLNDFEKIGFKGDWNKLLEDLKQINPYPNNIMFHYKYYNTNLGFYLIGNNYQSLDKFLKKFNYKQLYANKEKFKDLNFDLAINYDLISNQITGTGFSDYI